MISAGAPFLSMPFRLVRAGAPATRPPARDTSSVGVRAHTGLTSKLL
ncbi:hypothetical protein SGL43_07204 [Streptomyces globisporus]|uniref:Uncharacterized protein n=1 Tax=Streptomyces globisporus TaxID=1908 RepID=A0ABN8VED9_STRGL|nr:hypothetical protein SGL43_07204 [Streptomyces globisporus]